jgi:hypothetical protein
METSVQSDPGLYPTLLGESWSNLDEAVRRLHAAGAPLHAVGVFRVRHGTNWVARALAWLARLPAAGEAVDVGLVVTARGGGEEWRRAFAGRPLVSVQYAGANGLLLERMGAVEMRFRLAAVGGALTYETTSAALCVGSWRVPLPRWLRPRVVASEKPVGDGGPIAVAVEVRLPLLGRLVAYEGTLTCVGTPG